MMPTILRTPAPSEPWCVMGMQAFGYITRTIHVPESRAEFYTRYGWIVIARDSDNPLPIALPPGQMWKPRHAVRAVMRPSGEDADD